MRALSALGIELGVRIRNAGYSLGRQLASRRGEEGSIGEWVMILVMAVGIVLFIWSVAQPLLGNILRTALNKLFR